MIFNIAYCIEFEDGQCHSFIRNGQTNCFTRVGWSLCSRLYIRTGGNRARI